MANLIYHPGTSLGLGMLKVDAAGVSARACADFLCR